MPAPSADPDAGPRTFAWLLDTHHGAIYRFLVRLCAGERQEAEDLCQETFLRAFRAFDRLDGSANHRAWIYRIAYNGFLNDRRRRRRTEVQLDESTPADRVADDARELARAVLRFVAELPPKQRAALVLRRVEGREYGEVADVLGCSEESARANAYQALKKVRQRFGEEYESL
ncbi:MAG TPA: RNA polymerase sigma factor [Chloroflexota bacterium]